MSSAPRSTIPAVCLALGCLAIAAAVVTSVFSRAAVTGGFTAGALPQPELPTREIMVNGHRLLAEVADDGDERERGLSYRADLERDHGMLFVYPDAAPRRFWLHGMNFPLDLIFIRDGRVVSVAAGVPVTTAGVPTVVWPAEPADEVLEVNAGVAEEMGIEVGSSVSFDVGD